VLDLAAFYVQHPGGTLLGQASWPPLSSPADQTLQHRPEQLSMAAPQRLARRRVDGVLASPTACASKPTCIRRIAAICATGPSGPVRTCPIGRTDRPRRSKFEVDLSFAALNQVLYPLLGRLEELNPLDGKALRVAWG